MYTRISVRVTTVTDRIAFGRTEKKNVAPLYIEYYILLQRQRERRRHLYSVRPRRGTNNNLPTDTHNIMYYI